MPTYGETPLLPSHPAPRHTSDTRIFLLRGGRAKLLHRRTDLAYLDFGCS